MTKELLVNAAHITPSARQLAWQEMEFYAFVHFGMNTFTDREWGDGQESPALFAPEALDAKQWIDTIRRAGMRGVILTCKHHDGFCLWPSRFTEHSVRNSPWRNGHGDVVREVSDACRAAGLRFGVYLSPWDRHEPTYGQGASYDDFFVRQLTELATQYGDIFCFWFDGACGEGKNGKKQRYDWERYYAVIRTHQPGAVISVCGPDVRWCGNEAGHCRESEWSVVPAALRDAERIASLSQQTDDRAFSKRVRSEDEDLGSRAALENAGELCWYPAEVNTSIRPGWFYHAAEDAAVKSVEKLFQIYLSSVGANAAFLLNIPPNTRGLIADADVRALTALGDRIHSALQGEAGRPSSVRTDSENAAHPAQTLLSGGGYWQAATGRSAAELTLTLSAPAQVHYVILREELTVGQRIEAGEILIDGERRARFTVVGHQRICPVNAAAKRQVTIRLLQARAEPTLKAVRIV